MDEQTAPAPPGAQPPRGKPLYRQLSETLRAEISSGTYPVGTLLPTEQELCDRFQTSRYTVREALRLLSADGLIIRRQGSGSEVASQQKRTAYALSLSSLSELYAYAKDTRLVIDGVETVVPDDAMALQLGRKPGRAWVLAEGARSAPDGAIICACRVFINTDFKAIGPDLPTLGGAVHVAISDKFGIETDQVIQRTSLERADDSIARLLGIDPGDWAVSVRRRYLAADNRPILVSFNWHRPEDYSYTQVIRRD